jgi:polyhydroxyalkanoate synthesis regulator phasin
MICPKCGSPDVEQIDEECKCNKCGYEGKCEEFKPKDMKEETYKEFFAKKLEKYNVKSPAELSDEESKKFFDEVDTEWEGEKEEIEEGKKTDLFDKVDSIKTAEIFTDNIIIVKLKKAGMTDEIGDKIKEAGYFIKHAYNGFKGDSFELAPIKDAKKYGVGIKEDVDLSTKALYELSKGNTTEFISIVKDAMFIEVGSNDKYPRKV